MFSSVECFKTRILESGNDIFDIKSMKVVRDFNCERFRLASRPLRMVADPFLFVKDGRLFLFYEQFYMNTKGVIAMVSTSDFENWTDPVVVLDEPFHLSFPWVFEREGKVYMVPETGADRSVRLYEANDDLTSFSFVQKLVSESDMEGQNAEYDFWFGDSVLYEKDGLWFLLSTFGSGGINELHLFVSDRFTGLYKTHPKSPVCRSNAFGRNAGSLISIDDRLMRVAQDCENGYGDNVHVLEIKEMSENSYSEEPYRMSILPKEGFFRYGGHQISSVIFNGRHIVAADAKEYYSYLWNRVLSKMKLYKDQRGR